MKVIGSFSLFARALDEALARIPVYEEGYPMGTKNDPGQYDCYAKLEPDEPYFLLRAKDPCAWFLVMQWVRIREVLAGGVFPVEYRAKLDEAWRCAESMRDWANKRNSYDVGRTESLANAVMRWFEEWKLRGGKV